MSQILCSSSVLDLPLCSHCHLEEVDRASAGPEGPGRCESAMPHLSFACPWEARFSPLYLHNLLTLSPHRDRAGARWCFLHWRS